MLKQGLELKQSQKLSPLQIQTIKLIELPVQELEQRIRKELEENPTLRLEQLIGLPAGKGNTTFTAFWADPKDVIRPAYVTDITAPMTNIRSGQTPETDFDKWYTQWFDDQIIWSYFDSAYPWTRLGYTYDWADNGQEYGLSEFVVRKDSRVEVAFTMTTEEFLKWLGQQ